jgi:hypothetical protein
VIQHRDAHRLRRNGFDPHFDGLSALGELDGVGRQLHQHLNEPVGIGIDDRVVAAVHGKRHPVLLGLGLHLARPRHLQVPDQRDT